MYIFYRIYVHLNIYSDHLGLESPAGTQSQTYLVCCAAALLLGLEEVGDVEVGHAAALQPTRAKPTIALRGHKQKGRQIKPNRANVVR
jgi:hypothetical protein